MAQQAERDGPATVADGHNWLVRCEGETLNALLRRSDNAIATVSNGGDLTDEINR